MRILLLGSGGREHALAWKLSQSKRCEELFIAPGNPGTAQCGTNVSINPLDFAAVRSFVDERAIDMIVVGPEAPLVSGIYDFFGGHGVYVIGPSQQGAMLEGSKDFAKAFMMRHGVPTAAYRSFTRDAVHEALTYLDEAHLPVVLKADGLAAGKGVVICTNRDQAKAEFGAMIGGRFGAAGDTVVIEEFLSGKEVSVFVLTDGEHFVILPPARDYKRIGEGDTGPNTGGMGAVSPVEYADHAFMKRVVERIVQPMISGLKAEDIVYKGILYCGLMKVGEDPYVIEFNCRFGDPETQVVLPRLKSDLVDLFEAVGRGTLGWRSVETDPRCGCAVVVASKGYPEGFEKGMPVELPDAGLVFHAGTSDGVDGRLVTSGGRVVTVTALAQTPEAARSAALQIAEAVQFRGAYFRRDIGLDV